MRVQIRVEIQEILSSSHQMKRVERVDSILSPRLLNGHLLHNLTDKVIAIGKIKSILQIKKCLFETINGDYNRDHFYSIHHNCQRNCMMHSDGEIFKIATTK